MSEPTLRNRVTILERKVEDVSSLPARVAAVEMQIVQLREKMRGGVSAIRGEMAALGDTLRGDFRGELHAVHGGLQELRDGFQGLRGEFQGLHGDFQELRSELHETAGALRAEIREGDEETRRLMREGDEETRRYMRVLHEEVIARIATISGRRAGKKR